MKKFLMTSLVLLLALLFVACHGDKNTVETTHESAEHTAEETTTPLAESDEMLTEPSEEPTETTEAPTDMGDAATDMTTEPTDVPTETPTETSAEEPSRPQETPDKATVFSVVFGDIYTDADKGTLYDGKLRPEKRSDATYLSGVSKNDWMEFQVNTAQTGEYSICMVFGGADNAAVYTVYVDGYKAATIKNKAAVTADSALTDSTNAKLNLTEGIHTIRVVMGSDGPDLYAAKFALTRKNIALNKQISSDSVESPQQDAAYANDGDAQSKWSAKSDGEASLIIDLKDFYILDKIAFLFENATDEYSISVSMDGIDYKLACNGAASPSVASAAFLKEYHLNDVMGRYVKITRTLREDTTEHRFAIHEIYLYGEVYVIPPEPEFYENYIVPHSKWTVSGHCPQIVNKEGHNLSPMVAAGGVEKGALLHQGSIGIGKIDLSKYDKVIIYYGLDNSATTQNHYNASENNRIMLTKADTDGTHSPENSAIIASATYHLNGWAVGMLEIDLSNVKYNGSVYISYDTLPGTFMLISTIEFVGGQK